MKPIVWMAHPLSGDVAGNIARAKRWLRWCIRSFPLVDFAADWILWCEVLNDGDAVERERGLRFDEAMVRRLDGIWLVGGSLSPGMEREYTAALLAGKTVHDLIEFGEEPPATLGCSACLSKRYVVYLGDDCVACNGTGLRVA